MGETASGGRMRLADLLARLLRPPGRQREAWPAQPENRSAIHGSVLCVRSTPPVKPAHKKGRPRRTGPISLGRTLRGEQAPQPDRRPDREIRPQTIIGSCMRGSRSTG